MSLASIWRKSRRRRHALFSKFRKFSHVPQIKQGREGEDRLASMSTPDCAYSLENQLVSEFTSFVERVSINEPGLIIGSEPLIEAHGVSEAELVIEVEPGIRVDPPSTSKPIANRRSCKNFIPILDHPKVRLLYLHLSKSPANLFIQVLHHLSRLNPANWPVRLKLVAAWAFVITVIILSLLFEIHPEADYKCNEGENERQYAIFSYEYRRRYLVRDLRKELSKRYEGLRVQSEKFIQGICEVVGLICIWICFVWFTFLWWRDVR